MVRRGFLLISAMIIMVMIIIAVLGVSFFILERSRSLEATESGLKSFYLAESGINKALYDYRDTGCLSLGSYQVAEAESFELSGEQSGLLTVDANNTTISTSRFWFWTIVTVSNISMDSVTSSQPLTVDRIRLDWTNTSMRLFYVVVDGSIVWNGYDLAPVDCNITNTLLNCPASKNVSFVFLATRVQSDTIEARFTMSDGTYKEKIVYPANLGKSFTFLSTGKSDYSYLAETTLQAEYDIMDAEILDYQKVD